MEKIAISQVVDLTEGGCNACRVTKSTTYTFILNDQETTIDELSAAELVQAVAMKNGWRQELKMDFLDEYVVFKKVGHEVAVKEDFQGLSYERGSKKIMISPQAQTTADVFQLANQILTELFETEPFFFELS